MWQRFQSCTIYHCLCQWRIDAATHSLYERQVLKAAPSSKSLIICLSSTDLEWLILAIGKPQRSVRIHCSDKIFFLFACSHHFFNVAQIRVWTDLHAQKSNSTSYNVTCVTMAFCGTPAATSVRACVRMQSRSQERWDHNTNTETCFISLKDLETCTKIWQMSRRGCQCTNYNGPIKLKHKRRQQCCEFIDKTHLWVGGVGWAELH